MPHGLPTSFGLYAQEIKESVKDDWSIKMIFAGIFSFVISWLGVGLASLLGGLLLVALLDLLLSFIPGNKKEGAEKDHSIQAKAWSFITNIIAIIATVKGQATLNSFINNNKERGWLEEIFAWIGDKFHLFVIAWIFGIYFYRIVYYVAKANRTKVPKVLKDMNSKMFK